MDEDSTKWPTLACILIFFLQRGGILQKNLFIFGHGQNCPDCPLRPALFSWTHTRLFTELAQFGLGVKMSVGMSTFHVIFFASTECNSTMDWCRASIGLAWSPKNGEVFQNGFFCCL